MKKGYDPYFILRVVDEICDLAVVSILWIIGCLPIFTIGASTKSLFFIGQKKVRKESCNLVVDFIECYKKNFIRSLWVTLFLMVLWFFSLTYLIASHGIMDDDSCLPFLLMGLVFFECTLISTYLVYILANSKVSRMKIMKDSFFLPHIHFLSSLKLYVVIISFFVLLYYIPGLLIILPGGIAIIATRLINQAISDFWTHQEIIGLERKD